MVCLKTLALSALTATASAQSANATVRYMPFGDSITEIICWRAKLWEKLQGTEWASVNFVGSGKTENNCKDTKYDRDNEGHSGFLAIDIANKNQLDGWLKTNPADVITMHLGTNDIVQQNKATADVIAAFTKLVATMRTSNPRMKIVVRPVFLAFISLSYLHTQYRSRKSFPSVSETTTPKCSSSTPPSSRGLRASTRRRVRSGWWISIRDSARVI
jgi:lysophospholipase L1-like esterase